MARITFIGAAGVVTGSKHLVETDAGARVLLDCGLYQGEKELSERNWTPPPVDPSGLDAVLLSHAHLDHCGYLPALVQQGFAKPIYSTAATADTAALVLRDSARLQEDESKRAAKHPERGLHERPLYTPADVERTLRLFAPLEYGAESSNIAGCRFRLSDAGHIIGSAIVELWFDRSKLTFSGDLGRYGRPLLRDPSPVAQSDYVLCESTYGDRVHPPEDPQALLGRVINAAARRKGVLVIPAFAVGRTQELLYAIGQLQRSGAIGRSRVYVDSPMAIAADEIMENHPEGMRFDPKERFGADDSSFGAADVTVTRSATESIALNDIHSGAIIIASSGMASGGRVLHHLRNRLGRPNDTVCFVGFQSPGTIGAALTHGAKSVRVLGVPLDVRASIGEVDGFSAHADREELLRWFGGFAAKPQVYLVHADPQAAASLASAVSARCGMPAQAARQGQTVEIR
ncbi:MAG: MBL fold metallo-hydrolase [Candidatus Eremiobacteraeota bacterium]|nr:MBL fold metallo-hydrolase [Candidatus Eremiobacteraeota bacterium]